MEVDERPECWCWIDGGGFRPYDWELFYPIENDEDLAIAVDRNPKLTLSVTTAR